MIQLDETYYGGERVCDVCKDSIATMSEMVLVRFSDGDACLKHRACLLAQDRLDQEEGMCPPEWHGVIDQLVGGPITMVVTGNGSIEVFGPPLR